MASQQLKDIVQFLRDRNSQVPAQPTLEQLRTHADRIYNEIDVPQGVRFLDGNELPGTWTASYGAQRNQAVLYLHGGGYVMHTPAQYRTLTAALCIETHRDVFAVDYRRAPENPFPLALRDALNAYQWLYDRLGEDPSIVVAGDSAGGGLAVALMLLCNQREIPLPKGVFLISPWTDLTMSGDSIRAKADVDPIISMEGLQAFARSYLQEDNDPRNPLASPLFGDLAGLPPMQIHVGGDESLLDDATRLAARAGAAGVDVTLKVWPGMFHEWHMWHTRLPEARSAVLEGAAFIRGRFDA
ncbi:alpha/beta hydrolase [Cupriavidus sp. M-11]|uniref:alpha/beta hydrolase n=1 Tax=Cupriavidus sp. M-11 TaxID=3233038 RepID=UPI003F8DBBB4